MKQHCKMLQLLNHCTLIHAMLSTFLHENFHKKKVLNGRSLTNIIVLREMKEKTPHNPYSKAVILLTSACIRNTNQIIVPSLVSDCVGMELGLGIYNSNWHFPRRCCCGWSRDCTLRTTKASSRNTKLWQAYPRGIMVFKSFSFRGKGTYTKHKAHTCYITNTPFVYRGNGPHCERWKKGTQVLS